MKKLTQSTFLLLILLSLLSYSCKKDKGADPTPVTEPPPPANDEEIITAFQLSLRDPSTGISKTYVFTDPDGDGGSPAYYGPAANVQSDSVIILKPNTTYVGEIVLLDESKAPPVNISDEVKEEGAEHMLFYNPASAVVTNTGNPFTISLPEPSVTILYTDVDEGTPFRGIGLSTSWKTSDAKGNTKFPLRIVLKHQPGSKDGTFPPGETDISVDFKVIVN